MNRFRWCASAAQRLGRFQPATLLGALLVLAGLAGTSPAANGQIAPSGPPTVPLPELQTVAVPGQVMIAPGGSVVFDLPLPLVSPPLSPLPLPPPLPWSLPLQPGQAAPLPKVIAHWAGSGSAGPATVSDDGAALTISYASGLVVVTDRACPSGPFEFVVVCPHPDSFPAPNALHDPYQVNFTIADPLVRPEPGPIVLRPGQQTALLGGSQALVVRYERYCCRRDNDQPAGVSRDAGSVLLTPPPGYYVLPLLPDTSGCVPAVGTPGPMRCLASGTLPLLVRFSTFNDDPFGAHSTPPLPQNPAVTVLAPPAPGVAGEALSFSASVGTASAMRLPDSFVWDFGDGSLAQGQRVSHVYAAPGTYAVVLEVGDPFGGQDLPAVAQVVAADAPPSPESVTVVYTAGWNLVAGPVGTVFAGADGPLYRLQASITVEPAEYEPLPSDTSADPGAAYWAYFPEDTPLTLNARPQPVVIAPIDYRYMLIGNPFTVPASVSGADDVELYYGDSGFIATGILQPGDGALVRSHSGQRIVVAPVVP